MAKDFMEEHGFAFPSVLDSSDAALQASFSDYNACCVPLHYIIDSDYRIALAQPGFEKGYGKILGTLARLGVDTGVPPLPAEKPKRKPRKADKALTSVGSPVRGKGVIKGLVLNVDGNPIKDQSIRLRCPALKIAKAASTDENGKFIFRRLPPGTYDVTFEQDLLDESKDIKKEVKLEDNQKTDVNFVKKKNGEG